MCVEQPGHRDVAKTVLLTLPQKMNVRRRSLSPKEAKRRNPRPKVSKQSANSWEDAVSPQKKPNDAIPVQKSRKTREKTQSLPKEAKRRNPRRKVSKQSENSRRRSLSPKEAKRRNPRPKKVSKQSANSWEEAKSLAPKKKPSDAIPVQKRHQNSRQTREKTQNLSPQKRSQTRQSPSKKKLSKLAAKDAKSLTPKKKPIDASLRVSKRCQNSHRQTRDKAQSLSTPKRNLPAMQSPAKKGVKTVGKLARRRKVPRPPKEAKRIPV